MFIHIYSCLETVKAEPNAGFRTDTSLICIEKFDDIGKFLEFDEQLKNNEEKFHELVLFEFYLLSPQTPIYKT